MRILSLAVFVSFAFAGASFAQAIDFGDDTSQWANDGECDDMRFEGPGMTLTPLLDADIGHDASDCRAAFKAGALTLRAQAMPEADTGLVLAGVNFGSDGGEWANDGECDDPRFEGPGMTLTPLLHADLMQDATDCSSAFLAGRLQLRGIDQNGKIDFGDDTGEWANDGACDDMRFAGAGMTTTPLLNDDIMHDATDCRTAFQAGLLTIAGE